MWLACSGGLSKSVNAPQGSEYEKLQEQVKNCPPELAGVIERDLTRTFPTNYHFEKQDGIHAMRRVLLAYSIRNRQVGYCQSMNFLVALLLLHMEEKYAFWVLAAIVEDLGKSTCWSSFRFTLDFVSSSWTLHKPNDRDARRPESI